MKPIQQVIDERKPTQSVPTVSAVFDDGSILELLYDPAAIETRFAYWQNGS